MLEDTIPIYIILIIIFIFAIFTSTAQAVIEQNNKEDQCLSKQTTINFLKTCIVILYGVFFSSLEIPLFPIPSIYNKILIILIFVYIWFIFVEKLPKKWILKRNRKTQETFEKMYSKIHPIFSLFTKPLQIKVQTEVDDVSEEEILELISASSESGNMEESQHEYIENIFEFDDTNVEEICTHRSDVVNLSMEDSLEEWHQIIMNNRHTFYPIYEEDEDDVIGVLDTRDYFRLKEITRDSIMKYAVDKPFFVPENMKTDDLFRMMKQEKKYFAVILDEYGGMTGIVTLHDIVETILGEMNEADDEEEPEDIIKVSDTKFILNGIANLEEAQEALHLTFPTDEYETFGGYILGCYGKLPDDGTKFDLDLDTMHVHVTNMKNHRIDKAIVYLKGKE